MRFASNSLNVEYSLSRRLRPLGFALVCGVLVIVAMTWGVLQVQTTLAGFLNSESVWSKAQKQAVIDLGNYVDTGAEADFARFHANYDLLEADRAARDAIVGSNYNPQVIDQVFRHGNILPGAKNGMIFMLRYFAAAPHMREALAAWRSTDRPIAQLNVIAEELHRSFASGTVTPALLAAMRGRIQSLNDDMKPRTELFAMEIVRGAVFAGEVLFWGVMAAFVLVALAWFALARRILQGIRNTEQRYRLIFDSASDGIVLTDENTGAILDVNRVASIWTGRSPGELLGSRYASLFASPGAASGEDGSARTLLSLTGDSRPVETRQSMAQWGEQQVRQTILRDISERVAIEQERRIATKALGSIAEGVIIADADRRVLTVNAAHIEITGFSAQSLQGHRFDDSRRLEDDKPLPDSIWHAIEAGGNWRGEVISRRRDGSTYPELLSISAIRDLGGRVQNFVAVFTNISASKAARRRLEHMAAHDPLTGLHNRAEFERRCSLAIAHALEDRSCVAVMFIDLDAFKIVNDSYTHAIGDRLLAQVAERIRGELEDTEQAGRIGGDEFTVFVTGLASRDYAARLAQRLLRVLAEPVVVEGHEIAVTASIGIAAYPLDGDSTATLIMHADAAMYAAKSEERNAWRFYSPVMEAGARRRLEIAADLRQALARDEFTLVYQPSVELRTGKVVAVEALLRWQHPTRGQIMPDAFIPMAESLGLIQHIDKWVMQAACRQIRAWADKRLPPLRVAINVSASWFGHSSFAAMLGATLEDNGVDPRSLMLEITEGALLKLGESTERTMRALHELGVSVAIDDFGTGYSSLSYLKLPAVACLKIDRSFVAGIPENTNDVAIVEAMLAIARSLDIYTIAEGIETEAQHEFLLRTACQEGQGYLYARPLPPGDLEKILRSRVSLAPLRLHLVPPGNS